MIINEILLLLDSNDKEFQYISSQRYIDQDVVEEKIKNNDFIVYVSPLFKYYGKYYKVITDGHHSLEAAKQIGIDPEFEEQSITDNDNISYLPNDPETFLNLNWNGDDWYDVFTGKTIF